MLSKMKYRYILANLNLLLFPLGLCTKSKASKGAVPNSAQAFAVCSNTNTKLGCRYKVDQLKNGFAGIGRQEVR